MYPEGCPSPGDLIVTKERAEVPVMIEWSYINVKRIKQSHPALGHTIILVDHLSILQLSVRQGGNGPRF